MKMPHFLLLATLAFWGWQSRLLWVGIALGTVLESARFIKARFDLANEDFRRIWNLCIVLTLAVAAIVFTTNDEGGAINSPTVTDASNATVHTATTLLRWLPMTLFLFVAAQKFSGRVGIPLSAISLTFSRRRRKGGEAAPERDVDVSYPYFIVCLFAAGFHANQGTQTYFWGQFVLLAWAIWPARSRRFGIFVWLAALVLTVTLGYGGTRGIGFLIQASQSFDSRLFSWMLQPKTDSTQSITSMGHIGKLKLSPRIVIRLEPINGSPAPAYLREATYRFYHSPNQAWQAGSAGNEFADVSAEAGGLNWILLPGVTNNSAVRIACYLNGWSADLKVPEGLLPLPTGSTRLEKVPLNVVSIKMNRTGAVLASGPGLVIFNARFGGGITFDSPPDAGTNLWDLSVPTNEVAALDRVISEMNISGTDEEHKLQAVQSFFASKFTYSIWQGRDKLATTNATPLARFLLSNRSGHCEYFATATVLLLRELGIPARYAVGYAAHETSGKGYVVRERDAHAWCLAWNSHRNIWEDFDTTPGSWIAAEEQRASMWQWVSDFWSWLRFQIAKFRWGQTNLRQYVLWGLVPVMALLLFQIIFRRRKRKAALQNKNSVGKIFWPGLDSEFYQLESKLAAHGVPRQAGEPLADWLERPLAEPALADLRAPLCEILRLHYRHRFDPHGLDEAGRKLLAQKVRECLESLARCGS
jgi:hypothetical protein